ncbi:MAG: NADH-quinone oxidoreductase subunit [Solirubrobacteraceae bacterium]|jgi:NADH-quinone oxidoreductase subunit N|nr:NADH-quinone oxidoreductase subunit [Solirubrobacteraceae bacterium]
MTVLGLAAAHLKGPHVDFAALGPMEALLAGSIVVLMVGLLRGRTARYTAVPALTLVTLVAALGLTIAEWGDRRAVLAGAMRIDHLTVVATLIFLSAGIAATLLSWRALAPRESAHGEYHSLLLASMTGMLVLVAASNLVTLFVGLELLSIPLYVLCATELRRATSLESGLKYLIVGSVGSATLLYGLALVYGATGATDFGAIAASIGRGGASDPLLLTGIALAVTGLCFKASVAPFHQWTPDVYEGAPTPITAFMAVATKAAAFGVLLRLFDVALFADRAVWAPALAALATVTIVVGNVGALGQSSVKRILAYSSVAQAGYLLAGVVVASRLGARATLFYLVVYLLMNLAAFAVVIARERETALGDDIDALAGLGSERPVLAWSMTIAMLSLAGIPATAGFIGKVYLIQAAVDGSYTWLAVVIVLGSAVSLGYYLRVIAAMWMRPEPGRAPLARPAIAGGSPEAVVQAPEGPEGHQVVLEPEASRGRHGEVAAVAVLGAAGSIFFGIIPQPLFDLVNGVGGALSNLL